MDGSTETELEKIASRAATRTGSCRESALRAWDTGRPPRDLLASRDLDLDWAVFDLRAHTRHAHEIVAALGVARRRRYRLRR